MDTLLIKNVSKLFRTYRKSHNDGVFDAYTDEMRKYRSSGVITGLPDNYARGRIIGDYRRVALYGIKKLIEEKKKRSGGNRWSYDRQYNTIAGRGK